MQIPKEKQQTMTLIGLGALACVALVYFFWISPNLAALRSLRAEIARLDTQLQKAEKTIGEARKKQGDLKAARETVGKFEQTVPQGDPYSWVVSQMDAQSRRPNAKLMEVQNTTPVLRGKKDETPGYLVRAFVVTTMADYDTFGELVRDIENSYTLAELANLEITVEGQDPNIQKAKLTFETLVPQ